MALISNHPNAPELDNRSDLLKAQSASVKGKVNACPFGCTWKHLDEKTYCRHLIGFSPDGKTYEPMVRDPKTGQRVVRCRREKVEEVAEFDDDGQPVMVAVYQSIREPIKKGDVLVRISTSFRVYRDVLATGAKPEKRAEIKEGSADEITQASLENLTRQPRIEPLVHEPVPDFAVVE